MTSEPIESQVRKSVRCADVTRELAAPTGGIDASALSRHLASCPQCAAWSARAERFDQAWEATRPEEPVGGFDALWARIRDALDAPRPTLSISDPRTRRRRWVFAAVGLAQAAAVLLAVFVVVHRTDRDPKGAGGTFAQQLQALGAVTVSRVDVDVVDEGRTPIIRVADHRVKKVEYLELMETEPTITVAFDIEMLNAMESMAQ
jgi:hypothetical protein